jgi:pimeloyl-ACP methyl ester carboxylesterase
MNQVRVERKTCRAPDRVTIVYSAAGRGEIGLVFIHGGLADRSFWDGQLQAFASPHRVLAVDLAGHGESGADRKVWGLTEFGADVRAVVEAEALHQAIFFGNSLGGPVAVEAALSMPDTAIGVVGVDTFQRIDYSLPPEEMRLRAEAFRMDYAGSIKTMVKMLFHPDADPAVVADAEQRMLRNSPDTAYAMFMGMRAYDLAAPIRRLTVPLRSINGDMYPTDVESVRKIKPDFDALVMKHMGHYPMLERPDEFNRHVAAVVEELTRSG